jgi:hypothetical protein
MNEKDERWCSHHIRIGIAEPRHRGELCRYCDDFLKLWQVRPPVSILRDRHHSRRVSEKSIKAALEADGVILRTVAGVTKAVVQSRPRKANQNRKRTA